MPLATNGTQELEEGIIKEEILPALGNDIAPRLEPIKRDLVLVVEYHPGEPISVALKNHGVGECDHFFNLTNPK